MSATEKEESPPPMYLVTWENYLRPKHPSRSHPLQRFQRPVGRVSNITRNLRRLKLLRWYRKLSKGFRQLPLPRFLGFLRARNDDGHCKRKTGFEIYCEMASIHGFHIFVGAKTWQRIFWWVLICTAVLLSLSIVIMSMSMNQDTPVDRFIDTMMKPTSEVPFPAVTICGLHMYSKPKPKMNSTFTGKLALKDDLTPSICQQITSCHWENNYRNCSEKLKPIWTLDHRFCCSFNYKQKTFSSQLGVGLVLIPTSAGFEVLVHESYETPSNATSRLHVPSGSETHIMVRPFINRVTRNLASIPVYKRGCFLPEERHLFSFSVYNQSKCLSECRTEKIFKSVGCNYPHDKKIRCVKYFGSDELIKEEEKNCPCLPPCQFNRFEFRSDIRFTSKMPNNSIGNSSSQNRPGDVYLRVYYDSPIAEGLVLDVYENWMTFIGTFGGITGLFMGCSFVSVFELIFFACVRPTCNWVTRQQILWRRRRQQRVGHSNKVVNVG
ncbi:hypothetical protein KR009_008632 [Drosophila setifemur]|nr:hypothetical protein KR009_008632 [Drosophila setifemur]